MTGAILIRWGANIPGREAKGLEVFGSAVTRFEEYAKTGRIHAHREFFTLTGRDGGFMLIEGELAELTKILTETDTLRLNVQAAAIVEDFEIQLFGGGTDKAVQDLMGTFTGAVQELGYL